MNALSQLPPKIDKQTVIGKLKSLNTRDVDILHAARHEIIYPSKSAIRYGYIGILTSFLVCFTLIGILFFPAIFGMSLFLLLRGRHNVKIIEEAYSEYINS